jgi:predicted metal-dependent peptidase
MSEVVEKWFLVEPLLFAVWTTHELLPNPRIGAIRVRQGRVEFNPSFIAAIDNDQLQQVMALEAMRILLKHPYARQPANAELAYAASNLTLAEHVDTTLPLPRARDVFGSREFDRQFYEFYCAKLAEQAASIIISAGASAGNADGGAGSLPSPAGQKSEVASQNSTVRSSSADLLEAYFDPKRSGAQNTEGWAPDELYVNQIDDRIRIAEETGGWGSIPGRAKERILASLRPRLNYRAILRRFRASLLSVRRRLTRLKPNRRYGFEFLGSRYEFSTRLLFAVDVSGSISSADLARGFSVVNRLFKYGIAGIDVIQFDTQLQGDPLSLRRARRQLDATGRGGTSFAPVIEFIDAHREYDGVIIFTDGQAPIPPLPKNRRTRLLWLFNREETFRQQYPALSRFGPAAFLKEGKG